MILFVEFMPLNIAYSYRTVYNVDLNVSLCPVRCSLRAASRLPRYSMTPGYDIEIFECAFAYANVVGWIYLYASYSNNRDTLGSVLLYPCVFFEYLWYHCWLMEKNGCLQILCEYWYTKRNVWCLERQWIYMQRINC